ncbi:MAG TPA: PAS domain S-box protein [Actinoplanes sp.]|nr:PAS domain S-box protein [Actinoplanes sp.]
MTAWWATLGNLVIAVSYAAITAAIAVPVVRARQVRSNRLATATALIFFSCSVGHGLHALAAWNAATAGATVMPGMHDPAPGWGWPSAGWDLFTAGVGVYYWSLRRRYAVLLGGLYVDPGQSRRLKELEHFFTKSSDLLCILDADGRFVQVNPAWQRTLGFTADDLLGRKYSDFVHPDDVERSAALAADLFTHGTPLASLDSRSRCHDGSYRRLNWNATADPETGLIFAGARDVTDQREVGQARALLAAIVDSTTDAIIGSTLDGTVVSWNPAATSKYGYSAEEVIGQPLDLLLPADRAGETAANLRLVATGEPVASHDTVRRRKDGTSIHVALTVSAIRDSDGTVVGVASTSRDLTDRVKAEERFRRLVEFAPVALVIVDRDGVIVLANEQTNQLFGYRSDALVGRPIELLIPGRFHGVHRPYRRDYIAAPEPRLMGAGRELVALRHDGSEFAVEISLAPLDTDQGTLVSAAILDLTIRRQVEKAAADARDEALAAAQIKSQFVAMVSHEIRTPMNGVIGLTRLLLHTSLTPAQRRYAEAIRSSGRALLAIINDILDFSKIEAGKIELVDADFDLHVLLDDVVQVAAETGRAKDLEVLGHYPPALVRVVHGDAGRLRQILLNLLGNAVKFTERGEVLLRTVTAPDTADGRPQLTFSVTDTGIGISAAEQIHLFEPFSQVDAAADRQFGGTGLGLTICHQLISLMGGHLAVHSEPGRGSTFTFTIPLTPRPGQPEHPSRLQAHLTGQRVLIVDDNTSRHLLIEHVEAWGMTAAAAEDAQNALNELHHASTHHQPYDIALIDQTLPGLTGTELADLITDDPDLATTRLILLTSGTYHDAEAAGAIAMLAKPIGPSTLYDCLVEVMNGDTTAEDATIHDRQVRLESDHGIVLLAEDNDINQLVAVETLAELGYRADIAHNGLEALQLADTKPYLAILMDCQMPEMDGYTATEELRRREDTNRHIPIIAMTAGAFAEDRQRCLQAGMDDYLAKPIDPDELRTALDRWTSTAATEQL